MSLTSFLDRRDVAAAVKPLRPKTRRKIDAPLRVEPRSDHSSMVGTAFDYLLRFELRRQAPHAVTRRWIAEQGCDTLGHETWRDGKRVGASFLDLLWELRDSEDYVEPEVVAGRAWAILEQAKAAVASYVKSEMPTHSQRSELAAHAIRLAKLDQVAREVRLDPHFEEAAGEDVEDLLGMLGIVPFDSLLHRKTMLLNPTFGESSKLVDGADMDLIAGDLLVDFEVTKQDEMPTGQLDQLLGYYLLARHRRRHDPSFPEIRRVALYFGRQGRLWTLDTSVWTDHPDFPGIEEWFFERAVEVFGDPVERRKQLDRLVERSTSAHRPG